jgi:hypothetical protein
VAGPLWSTPVEEEGSVGLTTPRSSSTKRDGDRMLTGGDESMGTSLGGTVHGEGENLKLW